MLLSPPEMVEGGREGSGEGRGRDSREGGSAHFLEFKVVNLDLNRLLSWGINTEILIAAVKTGGVF